MIELIDVTKEYGKSGVKAVDHLTMKVEKGELFGFIGPNGAGKTTTIKMLTGILVPTSGTVLLDGVNVVKEPLKAKRMIGFVPDGADLFDRLTGLEYLNFMADIYGVSAEQRKRKMDEYLQLFELTDAVGNRIASYSKGMRQKLATIGALLHDPTVWILDEPMMGLDPKAAFLLKEEMKRQCEQGKTVFFSTHVLDVAEKLCTRIAMINHGKLAAEGTLEELKSAEHAANLEQIFLELTETEGAEEE
ncbi:MAG: ABC transporter ATP-binding protein [Clostridia bacterium]|nr:ABC transporter ATP-binding protein [Clostridia bacterium]